MPGSIAADSTNSATVLGRAFRMLHARSPARLLDIGCGSGRDTADLAGLPGVLVIALDQSANAIRAAPRLPNVRYARADPRRVPLAQHSVDAVYSFGQLQQLGNIGNEPIREAVREVARVLTVDGVAVLATLADFRGSVSHTRSLTGAEVSQVLRGSLRLHELIGLMDWTPAGQSARHWYIHAVPEEAPRPLAPLTSPGIAPTQIGHGNANASTD